MDFYIRALELKDETIANRRHIHENAETGLNLPKTVSFVKQKLEECGIEAMPCGKGLTFTLGKGGKCILLRADMDALPMPEESGLSFASKSGTECHACGHDFHTAMLITAARMLKEFEDDLQGTVKFMFQPAEETFEGAKNMIEAGVLEDPHVDVALAYHVSPGKMPVGIYMYNDSGTMMNSVDGFRIEVTGQGSHGAYPQNSIDPINALVHIFNALEAVVSREVDPSKSCVMTIGQIHSGLANNVIPESGFMEGSIRTNDASSRDILVRRMKEVAEKIACAFGATAQVIMLSEVPPLVCDPELTKAMVKYMSEMNVEGMQPYPGISASASEDFAVVAEKVPSVFMYLSAGYMDERGDFPAHNPKVQFNEDVCPIGSACLAECATRWLADNK